MKSNVPWSVKGIDPEARVVAKAAAKEAGMTLGEWMNQAIRQIGEGDGETGENPAGQTSAPAPDAGPATAPGVTTDQLRAVVDSLNRLNERLTTTEEGLKTQASQTRQTAAGLGQGLETVYERMKRLERERKEGSADAIQERVEKLERGEGDKGRIDGLKRLEGALTSMVEALEVTRAEAITKITENEEALDQLASRVDVLDDRLTAGFSEVHDAIDAVGEHLDRTERTAAGVLSDAKEASGSTDAEFVEQTSKRLQALGNEIKRSGDQIRSVEDMVGRLSAKIEAAEHRSAEGIGEVAASLQGLRTAVAGDAGAAQETATDELADAARQADEKVSRLQRSYETMMARLNGRAPLADDEESDADVGTDGGAPLSAGEETPVAADPAPTDAAKTELPVKGEDDLALDALLGVDKAETSKSPAETPSGAPVPPTGNAPVNVQDMPEDIVPAEGQDDDFDAAFADLTSPAASGPPPLLGGAMPLAAGASSAGAVLTAGLPGPGLSQSDDDADQADEAPKLTARQKVLLAARARKKRLEAEHAADEGGAEAAVMPLQSPVGADADLATDDALTADRETDPVAVQEAEPGQNRKVGLGLIGLLAVLVAAMAFASFRFFGGENAPEVATDTGPTDRLETRITAPPLPDVEAPVPLPNTFADASALYLQGKTLLARGQEADALRLFEEAAAANYPPAQFRAGHAYYDGLGTDVNLARAERLLSDAALNGNVLAKHYLGNIAVTGDEPNIDESLDWFTQAAEAGVVSSAYNLGYLYDPTAEEGLVPADQRDAAKAYYWYSIAAKQGDAASREEASLIAARLTPEAIAEVDGRVAGWTPMPVSETTNDGIRLPG